MVSYTPAGISSETVLYKGVTTSAGNAGKTILIDSNLISSNDFLTAVTIIITSGVCRRETRNIDSFASGTGTITVGTAFSAIIASGVTFAITARISSDVEVAALQTDINTLKQRSITNISMMEFHSEIDNIITLTTATANVALPDIIIADIPTNTTIVRVTGDLAIHSITDTSGILNAINTAGMIQIQKSVGGSYTNLITIPDNLLRTQASTEVGGMIVRGTNDAASEVTANGTYNLKFNGNIFVDGNNLELSDVQLILKIYFIAT